MDNKYKDVTKEDIEKYISETGISENYLDCGLRTPKQVAKLKHILGNFAFYNMGDKIYRLPGGGYCGQGGWDMFQKAMEESLKKLDNG